MKRERSRAPVSPGALCLAAALGALAGPAARACLHGPESFEGTVGQKRQEAIVFWNDGREELILRNTFHLDANADDGALPDSLGWIVPVPAAPDRYAEADGNLFGPLYEHWAAESDLIRDPVHGTFRGRSQVLTFGGEEEGGGDIELLQPVSLQSYEIQPIRATGEAGAKELNGWLKRNGFGQVPTENMRYYIEREWIWVCVKIKADAEKRLAAVGELNPLHVSFASAEIVYPLKFSTHQGEFELQLWVVTDRRPGREQPEDPPVDEESLDGATLVIPTEHDFGLPEPLFAEGRWMPIPTALDATQLAAAKAGPFDALDNRVGIKVPYVTRVHGHLDGETIVGWDEDLALRPGKAKPGEKPGPRAGDEVDRGPDVPVRCEVLSARATAREEVDDWEGALAAWTAFGAIASPQRRPRADVGRSDAHYRLGHHDEALVALDAAREAWKDRPGQMRGILEMESHIRLAMGDFEGSLAALDRLEKLGGDDSGLLFERFDNLSPAHMAARAHAGLGDLAKARAAVEESGSKLEAALLQALDGDAAGARAALAKEDPDSLWLIALGDDGRLAKKLEKARAALAGHEEELATATDPDERLWLEEERTELRFDVALFGFLAGEMDAASLVSAARAVRKSYAAELRAYAGCFVAMKAEEAGDAAGARAHYEACRDTGAIESSAYLWALASLHRRPPADGGR